jgi:hypothetical protein
MEFDMSRFILFLCALATMAVSTVAGTYWQQVSDVSLSKNARLDGYKNVLYLYDDASFMMSVDHGATWKRESGSLKNGVIAVERVGTSVFAFAQHGEENNVRVLKADETGRSWNVTSEIEIGSNDRLAGVAVYGTGIYAFSRNGKILASWDGGVRWNYRAAPNQIGAVIDMAVSSDVWVICGTDGAAWSSDVGITWHSTFAPVETGSTILSLETLDNTIWAGCRLGANTVNNGIPVFASLVATPLAIRSIGGVLFGVFKTYNGASSLLRMAERTNAWVSMPSTGLPPHNLTKRENFTVINNEIYLYHHGDDAGFLGVYKVRNDAPTSVDEMPSVAAVVSPLPASTDLTIGLSDGGHMQAAIVDQMGRTVRTFSVDGTAQINVSDLASGTYNLLLLDEQRRMTTHNVVIAR